MGSVFDHISQSVYKLYELENSASNLNIHVSYTFDSRIHFIPSAPRSHDENTALSCESCNLILLHWDGWAAVQHAFHSALQMSTGVGVPVWHEAQHFCSEVKGARCPQDTQQQVGHFPPRSHAYLTKRSLSVGVLPFYRVLFIQSTSHLAGV